MLDTCHLFNFTIPIDLFLVVKYHSNETKKKIKKQYNQFVFIFRWKAILLFELKLFFFSIKNWFYWLKNIFNYSKFFILVIILMFNNFMIKKNYFFCHLWYIIMLMLQKKKLKKKPILWTSLNFLEHTHKSFYNLIWIFFVF